MIPICRFCASPLGSPPADHRCLEANLHRQIEAMRATIESHDDADRARARGEVVGIDYAALAMRLSTALAAYRDAAAASVAMLHRSHDPDDRIGWGFCRVASCAQARGRLAVAAVAAREAVIDAPVEVKLDLEEVGGGR